MSDAARERLAVMSWVVRQVDSTIGGAVQSVCDATAQSLIADPVRMLLVGVERTRTWERAWKAASHRGISLRVHVGVEEAAPGFAVARVNSNVVAIVELPSAEARRLSEEGVDSLEVCAFREALTQRVISAVASWRAIEQARASAVVHLSGAPVAEFARVAR
jgi:hypothetical protein